MGEFACRQAVSITNCSLSSSLISFAIEPRLIERTLHSRSNIPFGNWPIEIHRQHDENECSTKSISLCSNHRSDLTVPQLSETNFFCESKKHFPNWSPSGMRRPTEWKDLRFRCVITRLSPPHLEFQLINLSTQVALSSLCLQTIEHSSQSSRIYFRGSPVQLPVQPVKSGEIQSTNPLTRTALTRLHFIVHRQKQKDSSLFSLRLSLRIDVFIWLRESEFVRSTPYSRRSAIVAQSTSGKGKKSSLCNWRNTRIF